ncbi:LysR family transcriptional regulator [Azorhizobium oxalatiphilum]
MELRHIRYFLTVADEGNFTRAAARLGIGQPPLSQQIKDLEREVGTLLFHRVPHGAELTEAGAAFLDAVKSMPAQAIAAGEAARRAARGETGQLAIGVVGTATLNPVLPASIRAYRRAYPEVELKLEEGHSVGLVEGLMAGRLDVAILRPSASDPEELTVRTLLEDDLVAALPAAHPEARGTGGLDLAVLAGDPLIMTPRALGTGLHDTALEACRAAGFEPVLGQPAPQITSMLSLVAAELGVSLVPASMRQLGFAGVAYRTLRPPVPHVGLALAHRSQRPAQTVLNFTALARAAARRLGVGREE